MSTTTFATALADLAPEAAAVTAERTGVEHIEVIVELVPGQFHTSSTTTGFDARPVREATGVPNLARWLLMNDALPAGSVRTIDLVPAVTVSAAAA